MPPESFENQIARLRKKSAERLKGVTSFESNGFGVSHETDAEGKILLTLDKDGYISKFIIENGVLELDDFEDYNRVFNKNHPLASEHQAKAQSLLDTGKILI